MNSLLTQDELLRELSYHPDTGIFTARRSNGRRKAGVVAGVNTSNGYLAAMVKRKNYLMHRLAWLYMTGEWPKGQIDHVDGNKSNNAFLNLREATDSQNQYNRKKQNNNTSGFKGVSWHKKTGRFRAYINSNGKHISLGYYATADEAHMAYIKKAKEIAGGFHNAG